MIQVENLVKTFDGFRALDGADFHVKKGAIYGLVGPNGAGKSTLIRHLTGIYKQDEGSVLIDGEPVFENPAAKEKIAYIPDDLFSADRKTGHRVRVVSVHSVELDRHAVDVHDLILYRYLPDSYPVSDDLSSASDDDSVEEWSFCIPQNRRVNR